MRSLEPLVKLQRRVRCISARGIFTNPTRFYVSLRAVVIFEWWTDDTALTMKKTTSREIVKRLNNDTRTHFMVARREPHDDRPANYQSSCNGSSRADGFTVQLCGSHVFPFSASDRLLLFFYANSIRCEDKVACKGALNCLNLRISW